MSVRVGYIGLGDMGRPMSSHLAPAGFATTVFDVDDTAVAALVATGAAAASDPASVAAAADVLCICVRTDEQVRAVLLGTDGRPAALDACAPGTVVAIHSTVLPETVHEMAAAAGTRGVRVVDACVTGGSHSAATGDLVFLVGGDEADVATARPVFDASAATVIHAGALGSGASLKIAINALGAVMFAAATEAYRLVVATGVEPEAFLAAGTANGQLSDMQQRLLQSYAMPDEVLHHADFQSRMRVQMWNAEKDLAHAVALANAHDVALPTTALVSQLMARIYQVDDPGRR